MSPAASYKNLIDHRMASSISETDHENHITDMPFVPECEVITEGGPSGNDLYDGCKKNPGHQFFIAVDEFDKKHLPAELQNQPEIMKSIQTLCDSTVKITTHTTSTGRPDTYPLTKAPYPYSNLKGCNLVQRCGTGFIDYQVCPLTLKLKPCPCPVCLDSSRAEEKHWEVCVVTATHVIFNKAEAVDALIELFYDREDRKGVEFLYGIDIIPAQAAKKYLRDVVLLRCVTHDEKVVKKLERIESLSFPAPMGLMVSHPHGMCKKITVGSVIQSTVVRDQGISFNLHDIFPWFRKHIVLSGGALENISAPIIDGSASTSAFNDFPPDSKLKISPNLDYICHMMNHEDGFRIRFPPGTVVEFPDGNELQVSPDTEFHEKSISCEFMRQFPITSFVTYDTPTCPGCSGARVFTGLEEKICYTVHAGGLKYGLNRSGVSLDKHLLQFTDPKSMDGPY